MKVVDQIVADIPDVADGYTVWMVPNARDWRVWKSFEINRIGLVVADVIEAHKQVLLVVNGVIEFGKMGVQSDWQGCVESEATRVQTIALAGVVSRILCGCIRQGG